MKAKELGLLLDKQAYSESSMILHFYTLERGFQSFIFKGALKKRKALNQMGLYEINYFKRPESDLGIINQLDFAWTPQVLFERPQKVLLVFFMILRKMKWLFNFIAVETMMCIILGHN